MADPPLEDGAVQLRETEALPEVAVPMVGAPRRGRRGDRVGRRRLVPVPTAVDGRHLEGVGGSLVRPVTVSVVAVELKVWAVWATPPM